MAAGSVSPTRLEGYEVQVVCVGRGVEVLLAPGAGRAGEALELVLESPFLVEVSGCDRVVDPGTGEGFDFVLLLLWSVVVAVELSEHEFTLYFGCASALTASADAVHVRPGGLHPFR